MLKVNRSPLYARWFSWYSRRLFARHFDRVMTFGTAAVQSMDSSVPVIFYCNHAYWWDGFWSHLCTETYFRQNLYIIIEDKQLIRYKFFTRLGAFSVNREHPREAVETIAYAAERLSQPSAKQNALWIFPQGVIEHVDKRPLHFYGGASAITQKVMRNVGRIYLAPLATRIDYLDEQKPTLFLSFKPPVLLTEQNFGSGKALTALMQSETESHLDELKQRIVMREFGDADLLVQGRLSVNRKFDQFKKIIGYSSLTSSSTDSTRSK